MHRLVVDLSVEGNFLVGIKIWPVETLPSTVDGIADGVDLEILALRESVLLNLLACELSWQIAS